MFKSREVIMSTTNYYLLDKNNKTKQISFIVATDEAISIDGTFLDKGEVYKYISHLGHFSSSAPTSKTIAIPIETLGQLITAKQIILL